MWQNVDNEQNAIKTRIFKHNGWFLTWFDYYTNRQMHVQNLRDKKH